MEFIVPDPGREWAFQTRTDTAFGFAWHAHDEYELTIIASGSGRRFAGDGADAYVPGDVALFGPRLPHTYASDFPGEQKAYVAHFSAGFVRPWCAADEFAGLQGLLDRSARGVVVLRPSAALHSRVDGLVGSTGPRQTLALVELLVELSESSGTEVLAGSPAQTSTSSAAALNTVVGYLERHYLQPVSRDDVAAAVAMSPSSVSRLLRRQLGTTLSDYVTGLRIAAACRELAGSGDPIASIAHRCGFANLSNFNRTFRRHRGTTPRAYRAAFSNSQAG